MKNLRIVLFMFFITIVGCSKNFLYKAPIDSLTPQTSFSTYANFQTYAWKLYDYMSGYGGAGSQVPPSVTTEINSDNIVHVVSGGRSVYSTGSYVPPATSGGASSYLQISSWDFSYVRSVDVMLDAIDNSSMTQSDKNHWKSVGYFFRALRYYDLIAAFGDVPWLEHALTDTSNSVLYGPRTPRDTVAANILNNLIWADANIGSGSPDGANTINQACVDALISRFGLFEGTWRKYHGLSNAETYLNACVTYSGKLMTAYPTLMSSYDDVFNSQDLTGQPGIILFKQYVPNANVSTGSSSSNPNDWVARYEGSTNWPYDVPKDVIDAYLCTDGKPISTSSLYAGDSTMYNEFRNRDRRLYFTVIPPYEVKFKNTSKLSATGNSDTLWTYTSNPGDAEYVTLMNNLPGNTNKRLPLQAQSPDMQSGNVIPNVPHFTVYPYALGNAPTKVSVPQIVSQLGFFLWKYYNRLAQDNSGACTNDCPIFRMGEVLLNDAEASFELGSFNQSVADATINKLRVRANVAPMVVAGINGSFDLNRDPAVDPVLWEIRRERRVELIGDGLRFNDLKRWAKGTYLNNYPLGAKVYNATYGNKLSIAGGSAFGYVQYFPAATGWNDMYYLEPIPLQELVVNPQLTQNPGWPSK